MGQAVLSGRYGGRMAEYELLRRYVERYLGKLYGVGYRRTGDLCDTCYEGN